MTLRKLITAALLAALGLATAGSSAEAGVRYRRDGTPRLPTKAVKALACCHRGR